MGKRQKLWAKVKRQQLMHALGNRCAFCGNTEFLTFDCKVACGHSHHALDTSARMSFYLGQFRAGNLQVLCQSCNAAKADEDWADFVARSSTVETLPLLPHHEANQPF